MRNRNDKPIRIAQIIGKMWAGGVEAVVFNYYRKLDHSEIQFDFYYDADSTVGPPPDLIEMGARFYKLPPYQKLGKYILQLRKYLLNNNYNIVHSHLNTLSVFPLFAAWTAGIPIRIAHNHSVPGGGEWKRNAAKNILKLFSKIFATDYFACSEKAGRWLFGNGNFNNGKVLIIKNAIDFGKFSLNTKVREELKEKYTLEGYKIVGHVGRFTFAKNHFKLLGIFKELHEEDSKFKLILVGDGELHDQIFEKIKEMGLEGCVICVGKVQNPEVYYSLFDIVVLPSYYEGLPMTMIESQVSGVPLVISKAVTEEAVISNGCKYMDIDEPDKLWAAQIKAQMGRKVILNEKSGEFDIDRCAPRLQKWYIDRQIRMIR